MIVIQVQPANEDRFALASELAVDDLVIGAAARLESKSAVGPELAVGAEAKRGLNARNQQGRTDCSHKGNAAEHCGGRMLAPFFDEIAAYLPAQSLQAVQLLEHALGTIALSRLLDLAQPLFPAASGVEFLPVTRNRQAAIQCLEPTHHSRGVVGQRAVAATQFLEG